MGRGRLEMLGKTKQDEERADVTLGNLLHVGANTKLMGSHLRAGSQMVGFILLLLYLF